MISPHRKVAGFYSVLYANVAVLAAVSLWLSGAPAHAELRLCNQTSYVLYAAVGIQQASLIETRGWSRVVPGDCATAIEEPLKAPAYFVYAHSSQAQLSQSRNWGGQFQFCVRDENFSLEAPVGTSDCRSDGAFGVPFASISTGGAQSWTMTLTDSPALKSVDDARNAGIRRLLAALGYPVGTDRDTRPFDDSLAKFRQHAKLAANASSTDLFNALEAQAKNAQTAQGYAICNDGKSEIWAALGFWTGQDFVSRGWWNIAAGNCTTAINETLGHDQIYLYASKHGNSRLVSGPDNFCISNTAFDIHGRDRCEAHGFSATGFLATNAKGLPGFIAHIGENGLSGAQLVTPK